MNISEFMKTEQVNGLGKYSFGKFVRQRREELGITLRSMAAELGVTPAYVSDIEKGHRYAPTKYMQQFSELLRLSETDKQDFEDLASASRGNQYEDINLYLCQNALARKAVRKARDNNISDDQWRIFIAMMDEEHNLAQESRT